MKKDNDKQKKDDVKLESLGLEAPKPASAAQKEYNPEQEDVVIRF